MPPHSREFTASPERRGGAIEQALTQELERIEQVGLPRGITADDEGQVVEWKLAERFRDRFEFEEVDFLNDIHETTHITFDLLDEARTVISKV
jgi:hypothetical protein